MVGAFCKYTMRADLGAALAIDASLLVEFQGVYRI
jgi:hypothetical protein